MVGYELVADFRSDEFQIATYGAQLDGRQLKPSRSGGQCAELAPTLKLTSGSVAPLQNPNKS
jgi:hypothetical protein